MSKAKQTKKPLAGTPPDQKPISSKKGVWAITEHPHAPTNKSPFAESNWSFADQLLNLRGGMVSSIQDIFKLNKFAKSAKQRMNRLRKDTTANTNTIDDATKDVNVLKDWRITATKQISEIIGDCPVSPIGTQNLTQLTRELDNQKKVNEALGSRIATLEGYCGMMLPIAVVLVIVVFTLIYQAWS